MKMVDFLTTVDKVWPMFRQQFFHLVAINVVNILHLIYHYRTLFIIINANSFSYEGIRNMINTLESYSFQYGENLSNSKFSINSVFLSYSNIQLRIKLINPNVELTQEERQFNLSASLFHLSRDALPQKSGSGSTVVVICYKALNSFFTTSFTSADSLEGEIKSQIITARIRPKPSAVHFEKPVRIIWDTEKLVSRSCFLNEFIKDVKRNHVISRN